jgi:excisionase family DNA binding protein
MPDVVAGGAVSKQRDDSNSALEKALLESNNRDISRDSDHDQKLPDLRTSSELATYLGVPITTIYHWRGKRQGPPGFRVGKRLCFRATDVVEWLEERSGREPPMNA